MCRKGITGRVLGKLLLFRMGGGILLIEDRAWAAALWRMTVLPRTGLMAVSSGFGSNGSDSRPSPLGAMRVGNGRGGRIAMRWSRSWQSRRPRPPRVFLLEVLIARSWATVGSNSVQGTLVASGVVLDSRHRRLVIEETRRAFRLDRNFTFPRRLPAH